MPRYFVHFTFACFLLTALSGVWMRVFPFYPSTLVPYENVLHGHSHLAVLGWTFLGAFIVFLALFWKTMTQKKEAKILVITLFIVSLFMFVAFIYQGYGGYSIAMSATHIFAEYWAITLVHRILKKQSNFSKTGKLFIYGALVALFISSLGPYAIGIISANDLKHTAFYEMAIYFYLHFQYNGWLYLFLGGLFIFIVETRKIKLSNSLLNKSFWVYFLALFPGYFLNVLWADFGIWMDILAVLGSIGQWIAVLLFLAAVRSVWGELVMPMKKFTKLGLLLSLTLLLVKSTMELGLIHPELVQLVYETRSIVIGYLHLTLLGFVSIFIVTQFHLVQLVDENSLFKNGFYVFLVGFILNELWLFSQGLLSWLKLGNMPYFTHTVLIASILLLCGVIIMWTGFKRTKKADINKLESVAILK